MYMKMSINYEKRIIIVGKSGNGKSSLGNTLLGKSVFCVGTGPKAITKRCQLEQKCKLNVLDTPGLFDSENLAFEGMEILKSINILPNPDAFLIVLNSNARLTQEEVDTVQILRLFFGESILEYAIVVLTHVDDNVSDEGFQAIWEESEKMTKIIEDCGNRVARIDNKENSDQSIHVKEILAYVDEISEKGKRHLSPSYQKIHAKMLENQSQMYKGEPIQVQVKNMCKELRELIEEEQFKKKLKIVAGTVVTAAVTTGAVAYAINGRVTQNTIVEAAEKMAKSTAGQAIAGIAKEVVEGIVRKG